MGGKTKTPRTDQKSTIFFLKIQDMRRSKTPSFEKGSHKTFLGQVLTIFQTSLGRQNIILVFSHLGVSTF